ncbi:hypothetical protein QFC22_003754 [Naganishia vaughanmartiniae]|uniref:Uncharacterized protein n=1 Tax=Naganishia vaughanmartiniae TaxID=1424756 RepID=A0ACC2X4L2_9TREE|nr:hypothetical protein QFC22_003754 [Naganishia vaughanmartiniae]
MFLLRYLPALIPLAIGVYIGLAWDSLNLWIGKHNGSSQSEYEVLEPLLVAEIEALRKRWDITGVSVAVVKQDPGQQYNEWRSDTFGLGEADGSGTPVDEDTLFSIASNTKLFVALSTGITVENETSLHGDKTRFGWDTKMKDIIPNWQLMDPVASEQSDLIDLLSEYLAFWRTVFVTAQDWQDMTGLSSRSQFTTPKKTVYLISLS